MKKTYNTPVLAKIGKLSELTQGKSGLGLEAGIWMIFS